MTTPFFVPIDHLIIMHCQVHFDGDFEAMIQYYQGNGEGINPDFELSRIEELAAYEKEGGEKLAEAFLYDEEKEEVEEARQSYRFLRALQLSPHRANPVPRLTADLVLAEDSYEIEKALSELVLHSEKAVPAMIDLLCNEQFHNALFPGYGLGPSRAATAISRLGDKRAIIALFEAIGREEDFFDEDIILMALRNIGAPAIDFLVRIAKRNPIDNDSEKAIIALSSFKNEPSVSEACWQILLRDDVWSNPILVDYLILSCEGLEEEKSREAFKQLALDPRLNRQQRNDVAIIVKSWEK